MILKQRVLLQGTVPGWKYWENSPKICEYQVLGMPKDPIAISYPFYRIVHMYSHIPIISTVLIKGTLPICSLKSLVKVL